MRLLCYYFLDTVPAVTSLVPTLRRYSGGNWWHSTVGGDLECRFLAAAEPKSRIHFSGGGMPQRMVVTCEMGSNSSYIINVPEIAG